MSFWIEGWIEVTIDEEPQQHEHSWCGAVRISPLVDVEDEVSERLFGLSKRLVTSPESFPVIAANRGVPPNPSSEVRAELDAHAVLEAQHGAGRVGGYTHATWAEVSSHRSALPSLLDSDWALVFDLAQRLVADYRYSADRVRLAVWFNW